MKKNNWLLATLIFLFVVENVFYLHYLLSRKTNGVVLSSKSESCSLACQEMMDQKIAAALKTGSSKRSLASISYIPLGDGGTTTSRQWVKIDGSEFVFDLADYPSGAKVFWEGNLKAGIANSRCYARIYDLDHYRAVDFSEQSTAETEFQSLTSQPLRIWAGKNHYRLEIRSLNGIACSLAVPRLVVRY